MVEQLPENPNNVEYSACQQIGTHDTVPDASRSNADVEMDSIHTFADRKRDILCPEATIMDVEQIRVRKICFASVQNFIKKKEFIRSVLTM
jgi:hypothetical protein